MSNDELKKQILARRAKFVAAALAASGLGVVVACGGEVAQGGDAGTEAGTDAAADGLPQPCLGAPQQDAGPQPCLDVAFDDAGDAGNGGG
jgi:hypothetical protein